MFYGFVITNAGNNLLNNMVAGEKLTITKVVMEKGTAESAEAARQLTAPIDPGPNGTSTKPTVEGNAVSLIVEYRSDLNGGLNEGFWIGGFAVYGKTDTSAEIMMYYGSLGDKKQYVSAYVSGTAPDVRRYPVSITVKDGITVDVSYPAEPWMTAEDVADYFNGTLKPDLEGSLQEILEQHDEDQTAHENRFQGKQDNLNTLQAKDNLVDADMVAITDSANNETAKRISWANIKALLNRIFVPMTRTVNNKDLTSDVTLTGADINVSGTDATNISTALSNKVGLTDHRLKTYVGLSQIGQTAGTETIEGIATGLPDGSCVDFFVDAGYNLEIYPDYGEPSRLGMCHVVRMTVSRVSFQFFVKGTSAFPAQMWLGFHSADAGWSGWFQGVIATPPQEFTLPMSSGWGGNSRYSKSQESVVLVNLYAELEGGGSCTDGTIIATLPAGYRPAGERVFTVSTQDSSGRDVAIIRLLSNGRVTYQGKALTSSPVRVFGNLAFIAD